MGKAKKFFMYLILTVASILSVFPLYYMFCASTNRSIDVIAGKLIQDAGLSGYQVGGAQVSEKHCGFVINKENAKATDVVNLIHDVQRIVDEKFQVQMDTEVTFLGDF